MSDKKAARAEIDARKFLTSAGFMRPQDKTVTLAGLQSFLRGKVVNGKVWAQASKSKRESLADLMDYLKAGGGESEVPADIYSRRDAAVEG